MFTSIMNKSPKIFHSYGCTVMIMLYYSYFFQTSSVFNQMNSEIRKIWKRRQEQYEKAFQKEGRKRIQFTEFNPEIANFLINRRYKFYEIEVLIKKFEFEDPFIKFLQRIPKPEYVKFSMIWLPSHMLFFRVEKYNKIIKFLKDQKIPLDHIKHPELTLNLIDSNTSTMYIDK